MPRGKGRKTKKLVKYYGEDFAEKAEEEKRRRRGGEAS